MFVADDRALDANKSFQEYFKEIRARYLTKDSTELSLRTPLENFIKAIGKDYNLIQEPKRTAGLGAPDFKAYKKTLKIGYIETKDLGKNLEDELRSEQIEKYTKSIDNIILTNYMRFILIRNQQPLFDLSLFEVNDLENSKFLIHNDRMQGLLNLIQTFFDKYTPQNIVTASELSLELSKRTKLLKIFAEKQLEDDIIKIKNNELTSSVYDFYEGAKELISDITIDDCADAYAETITYGLFLAKMNDPRALDRNSAAMYVPRSIGVIRRIFINISGDSIPSNLSWLIDEIIDVLNASKMDEVLSEIDSRGKTDKDPFTFFYEDFLSAYDPEKKKHLGVFYTPRPVVSFIINSINELLKINFDKPMGFADDSVTTLDPAAGTGTFLWLIYILTLKQLKDKGLGGLIREKIRNHILRDFYGLEIQITPYIIAHLKLSLVLNRWHYEFADADRNQVYLANTLVPFETHGLLPFLKEISEESRIANKLKMDKKILVITGNPPYRGMSVNKGQWIEDLLKKGYKTSYGLEDSGYYKVDGKDLGEKNPKWLQDDYVKFLRFAQWKIDSVGEGIVGFITNNSYLENPTFRGMRQSLLKSFNRIYVLDLHGSNLKRERSPDGTKDENVFNIRPGVAIIILVKNRVLEPSMIYHAEIFGNRDGKFYWLDRHNITNVDWKQISPASPDYLMVPDESPVKDEYSMFVKVTDIFPVNNIGIVTSRDDFTIKPTVEEVWNTVTDFVKLETESARTKYKLGKDVMEWKVSAAQADVRDSGLKRDLIVPILYRPFDNRFTYYTGRSRGFMCRPRQEIMSHMLRENIGLLVMRQVSLDEKYTHFFVSNSIVDNRAMLSSKGIVQLLPFYLYNGFSRTPNLSLELLKDLKKTYNKEVFAEEILNYVYAIFHSNTYRDRYSTELRKDFPRIPFTKDYDKFQELSKFGKTLIDLHLGKTKLNTTTKFNIEGSNVVESIKWQDGKVFINKNQFFDGVPIEIWNFHIGGYQVLDKWLKSHKNRVLTAIEIDGYLQIIETIKQTAKLMQSIDDLKIFEAPIIITSNLT